MFCPENGLSYFWLGYPINLIKLRSKRYIYTWSKCFCDDTIGSSWRF